MKLPFLDSTGSTQTCVSTIETGFMLRLIFPAESPFPSEVMFHILSCNLIYILSDRRDSMMSEGAIGWGTSTAAILVLFILLVIISKAFWV